MTGAGVESGDIIDVVEADFTDIRRKLEQQIQLGFRMRSADP